MSQSSLTRRLFCQTALAAGVSAGALISRLRAEDQTAYENLKSDDYLGPAEVETKLEDRKIFTEGPACDARGDVYFTNVPAEKILRWNPRQKRLDVFREQSGQANGLMFAPDGSLLACEGGRGRVTRTDMKTGEITVLADKYNNFPLAAPNDLCQDEQGRIYFSSRPGAADPTKGNVNAVYRIDTDGTLTQPLAAPRIHMPNGIVTSPDDKTLYLIESDGGENRNRHIKAFDLKDGQLSRERILYNFYPGRSGDGMCIDAQGNLYVAAGLHKLRGSSETLDTRPGIHVISPEGKLLAFRQTPVDTITNCTFGGEDLKTLYVTCGPFLLSIRTQIPGKPFYRPAG